VVRLGWLRRPIGENLQIRSTQLRLEEPLDILIVEKAVARWSTWMGSPVCRSHRPSPSQRRCTACLPSAGKISLRLVKSRAGMLFAIT
jgi:hypothetical protein